MAKTLILIIAVVAVVLLMARKNAGPKTPIEEIVEVDAGNDTSFTEQVVQAASGANPEIQLL